MALWAALRSDKRGVAAMEFGVIGLFVIGLLLPIPDVAATAIAYMRTYQAMRNLVAYAQFQPPPDITSPSTNWTSLPNTMSGYSVVAKTPVAYLADNPPQQSTPGSTITVWMTVLCGDPPGAACTAGDVTTPTTAKWYAVSANLKLNPIFLTDLTGGVLTFSERFQ